MNQTELTPAEIAALSPEQVHHAGCELLGWTECRTDSLISATTGLRPCSLPGDVPYRTILPPLDDNLARAVRETLDEDEQIAFENELRRIIWQRNKQRIVFTFDLINASPVDQIRAALLVTGRAEA